MKQDKKIYSYHIFMLPFIFKEKNKIIKNWQKTTYNIDYSQQAYFHSFFKNSIYKNIEIYTQEKFKNSKIIMKKSKVYELVLEEVTLRLFDTDIGILTFKIKNENYFDTKSILEINDYFRRIYPEYLDYEKEKCGLVPKYVTIGNVTEKFEYDKNLKEPQISKVIEQFLPSKYIKIAVDDRMFTISYFNNPDFTDEVKQNYLTNDKWYEYVFIDGDGKTVQDSFMQKKLIKNATYTRWKDYGTMYGMSKYSFVCLANSYFPLSHMKTMYFDMFTLLLMVRATLLKFSDEVSAIAKNLNDKNTANKVTKLYEEYIKFVNGYYFREITAKDQGLELYEMALNTLNIQRDVKDLDSEIEELFRYVEMLNNKIETEQMNKLTKLGTIFLPGSFLAGIYGMNIFPQINNIFGYLFVFGSIIGLTYWISKIYEINILDFFTKDKNEQV